jgi:hypothetical protein
VRLASATNQTVADYGIGSVRHPPDYSFGDLDMSWFNLFSRPSPAALKLEENTDRVAEAMGRIAERMEAVADGGERVNLIDAPPAVAVTAVAKRKRR